MNKILVKWVLTQQEEMVLYDLATVTACKVKGFREITRNNIKQIRPHVINELQKTTKTVRLKTELRKHINKVLTEGVVKDLQVKNQEELLELIDTKKYSLADVVIALITGEAEQAVLAETLFTSILEQESLVQYEPQTNSIPEQGGEPVTKETVAHPSEPFIRELEEILSHEKDKAVQLGLALKELREKRKSEVQEWKKERKAYIEEIKSLKTEVENERKQVVEQETIIVGLMDKMAKLQEEVKSFTKQVETKTAETNKPLTQPVNPTLNKTNVVLLGEGVNESILQTSKYAVELVGNSQIEDFLQCGIQAEEIWMLSFQISPSKQRKLRNAFTDNNFKEFATLVELQAHINKK
ncbi:MAG: hypothetical protein ACE3L7_15220 [Candidatus Pristimantibacillus sp.]